MNLTRLNQYAGRLDAAKIAAGMNAAARNARRLAQDASLLFDNGRFASAVALSVLSIEESGKVSILRHLSTAQSEEDAKHLWRDYRSHKKKNVMGAIVDLFANGARRLDQFALLFDRAAEHPQVFDTLKQIAIYTDCVENAHWSEPNDVIDEQLAQAMVNVAILLTRKEQLYSAAEIELWKKHMGATIHASRETASNALKRWYADMQANGLAEPGRNAMAQFIDEGVDITQRP